MDSLALLCNLYGDGPATLRRLREAGCGDLDSVAVAPSETLAGLLRTSARAARRFQAESRMLLSRVDSDGAPQAPVAAVAAAAVKEVAVEATDPEPVQQHGDPLMRRVLDAWREQDAAQPQEKAPLEVQEEASEVAEVVPVDALAPGLVDGLERGLCARLERVGVRTLRDLAEGDAFEIARAADLPFTRLSRFQLLARKAVAALRESGQLAEQAEPVTSERDPDPAREERGTLWPKPGPHAVAAAAQLSAPSPAPAATTPMPRPERFSPSERPPEPDQAVEGGESTRLAAHGVQRVEPPRTEREAPQAPPDAAGPFA